MTLKDRILELTNAIGSKIKDLYTKIGSVSALTTIEKGSIVGAINEIKASAGVTINDATANSASAYSSNKVESVVLAAKNSLKSELLGAGVSAAFDTLKELEDSATGQESSIANLLTAVGNRVRYDAAQALSAGQVTQVCNNIGIGEPDTDFVTVFNNSLL